MSAADKPLYGTEARIVRGRLRVPTSIAAATARQALAAALKVNPSETTAVELAYHYGALTNALDQLLTALDDEEAGR